MLQEKREGGVNIYVLPNSPDKLDEYDFKNVDKLNADWFVYWYKIGDWDGDGFAVWKIGGSFHYTGLGHCSCNGPTEGIKNTIGYSFKEVEEITEANYNDGDMGKEIIKYIKDNLS